MLFRNFKTECGIRVKEIAQLLDLPNPSSHPSPPQPAAAQGSDYFASETFLQSRKPAGPGIEVETEKASQQGCTLVDARITIRSIHQTSVKKTDRIVGFIY